MENSGNYLATNRLPNLDGIEAKLITHLIKSESHYAQDIWRLLKYNGMDALSKPALTQDEKRALVFTTDNGQPDDVRQTRVFMAPFVDDAWQEQCSSLYVYVAAAQPLDRMRVEVTVNIEVVVHSQTSVINGNGDPDLNPDANPNDSDSEGNLVVAFKNRATALLKDIIAEFNGLYLDGVGYLFFAPLQLAKAKAESSLWNTRAFFGHRISLVTEMSGVSPNNNFGF